MSFSGSRVCALAAGIFFEKKSISLGTGRSMVNKWSSFTKQDHSTILKLNNNEKHRFLLRSHVLYFRQPDPRSTVRPAGSLQSERTVQHSKPNASLLQPVDGKFLNVGQTIEFRVKYDVVINRRVVIAAGSPARGIITRLDKPKMMGKGGYMEIQPQYVNTIDNQMLPISASPMRLEGKKNGWAWAGVIVGVATGGVGAAATGFIKGKNARVESGMTIFASVASTREVWVNN